MSDRPTPYSPPDDARVLAIWGRGKPGRFPVVAPRLVAGFAHPSLADAIERTRAAAELQDEPGDRWDGLS